MSRKSTYMYGESKVSRMFDSMMERICDIVYALRVPIIIFIFFLLGTQIAGLVYVVSKVLA